MKNILNSIAEKLKKASRDNTFYAMSDIPLV